MQRCHRCFRQLHELYRVACRRCPQALYCSHACSAADPHHGSPESPECGLPWPALLPENALLASRLAHAAFQVGNPSYDVRSLVVWLLSLPLQELNHSDPPSKIHTTLRAPHMRLCTYLAPRCLTCIAAAYTLQGFDQMPTLSSGGGLGTWMNLIASRPLDEPAPARETSAFM